MVSPMQCILYDEIKKTPIYVVYIIEFQMKTELFGEIYYKMCFEMEKKRVIITNNGGENVERKIHGKL